MMQRKWRTRLLSAIPFHQKVADSRRNRNFHPPECFPNTSIYTAQSRLRKLRRSSKRFRNMALHVEFKTRVLTGSSQLRAIADEWSDLHQRCLGATPFQRPEWVISW